MKYMGTEDMQYVLQTVLFVIPRIFCIVFTLNKNVYSVSQELWKYKESELGSIY